MLSHGLPATSGVGLGIDGLEDRPQQTTIRAFVDAPPHIIRVASTELTAHRLNVDDDSRSPGSDPAISSPAVRRLALPAAVSVLSLGLAAPIMDRAISPTLLAPPASIV